MDQALEVYQPVNSSLHLTTGIAIILVLLSLIGLFWNARRKVPYENRHFRQLWTVLLGFLAMLSAVAAIFSSLTTTRIGPVKFFADRIETVEATIPFSSIQRAYIHLDMPQSNFGNGVATGDTTEMLIIVERVNQKTHVFSEYNYPVEELHGSLRKHLKAFQPK